MVVHVLKSLSDDTRPQQTIEEVLAKCSDEQLMGDFDDIYKTMPITKETTCGFSFLRGPMLQK